MLITEKKLLEAYGTPHRVWQGIPSIERSRGGRLFVTFYSEDECRSWTGKLLLDERSEVSYPDVTEAEDGSLFIVYDRERGAYAKSYAEAKTKAREILMARITEEDILRGKLTDGASRLKQVVSKLGEYEGDAERLYHHDGK